MKCLNCGFENKDYARFCVNCGTILEQESEHVKPNYDQLGNTTNDNSKKPIIIIGAIIGVIAVIALAIILAIIFHPDKERSDSNKIKNKTKTEEVAKTEEAESAEQDETEQVSTENETTEIESAEQIEEVTEEEYLDPVFSSLRDSVVKLNSDDFSLPRISVYEENYSVGVRDKSLIWDDRPFYAIEGLMHKDGYTSKNLCEMRKVELISADTGNVIDYEIYINPLNGVANKIVSIEYISDGLEITEYYFDNDILVNFVFRYYVDNYISTYATPALPGERFLYCNDILTTWRVITPDSTLNIVNGEKEKKRMGSSWSSRSYVEYDTLDENTKNDFDKNEKDMLNAAYNTYSFLMNTEGIARIQGYVYDADSSPVMNADIKLFAKDEKSLLYKGQTDNNGCYSIFVPSQINNYFIVVSKEGFTDCKIYDVTVDDGQIGAYQDTVYLFDGSDTETNVYFTLGDAFNKNNSGTGMVLLKNANVNIREGMNNRYGSVFRKVITDENGYICISLKQGAYTIEVYTDGYETMYYTFFANIKTDNRFEFYTAPTLSDGEIAIVLTWGATPSDLDSHLFTTKGSKTSHIWFGHGMDEYSNYLDVDDTTSYGPETVTIRKHEVDDYYKYCVVDYTNCAEGYYVSGDMSNSGAVVNVYAKGGLIGTFHVPTNMAGVIWEVFEIRNDKLIPIQRYYDDVSDKSWWNNEK